MSLFPGAVTMQGSGDARFSGEILPEEWGVEIFPETEGLTLYSRRSPGIIFAPAQGLYEVPMKKLGIGLQ